MKTVLGMLALMFCLQVFGNELEDGDRAKIQYAQVPIYAVKDVRVNLKNAGQGFHSGKVSFTLIAEGNICSNERSSFGTFEKALTESKLEIKLVVGGPRPDSTQECPEYAKETKVSIDTNLFIENGDVFIYQLGPSTVTVKQVNKRWRAIVKNPPEIRSN